MSTTRGKFITLEGGEGAGKTTQAERLAASLERNGYETLQTRTFYGQEKKVRVNTISQSPTATTAGTGVKGFDGFIAYAEKMSPLGNATAQDCADYTVSLFSDLTKKVTMQNLFHDGGFSNTGVSQEVIEHFSE